MIRTILTSNQTDLIIKLPDDLVGKLIEVIAFEVSESHHDQKQIDTPLKPSQLRGFLSERSALALQKHVNKSREQWDTL